jgi:hypothetical protein
MHFVAYGAMFIGRKSQALDATDALRDLLPVETVAFRPDLFEVSWCIRLHVLIRFGMWQALLDEPFPENAELFSFTTALQHYARTVALSNLGHIDEAETERDLFHTARAAAQETRHMFNNPAQNVLEIAHHMAEGELAYKAGNVEEGLRQLHAAVAASDGLLYDEPWGWMQPPRHALAVLLLEQGRHAEAESIYRATLVSMTRSPALCNTRGTCGHCTGSTNAWPPGARLSSGPRCSRCSPKRWRSEVPIRSSCYCCNSIA